VLVLLVALIRQVCPAMAFDEDVTINEANFRMLISERVSELLIPTATVFWM